MDISALQFPVNSFLNFISRNSKIGCWAIDLQTKNAWWSDTCFELLETKEKKKVPSLEDFVDNMVHPEDKILVTTVIKNYLHYRVVSGKDEVRIKSQSGHYNAYEIISEAKYNEDNVIQSVFGTLSRIDEKKQDKRETEKLQIVGNIAEDSNSYVQKAKTGERPLSEKDSFLIDIRNEIAKQFFFIDETSALANAGCWEINFENRSLYWSKRTKEIHEVDEKFKPTFDKAVQFYTASSRQILLENFSLLLETGKSYDLELELITATKNKIWVRSIAKPVSNEAGTIVKARGVIQDITEQKNKETELNAALNTINHQNDKLKDFTYIISHNLRSHAGNLKMITEMVEMETDIAVKLEWITLIRNVSASLNETVNNLNTLVTLNIENRKQLLFSEIFSNIRMALHYMLTNEEVELTADFSACEYVNYVPAYLENIMMNLITNAIKYRYPGRKPVISMCTAFINGRPLLKVRDNGLGIDLAAYGDRLFKMNQTFHKNSDARGIGLYITKNQVENMGGAIEVDSVVNEGTTFTVHF